MTDTMAPTHAASLLIERLPVDAAAQDLEDIASIQAELAIAFELLAAGVRESDRGFLISAYKPDNFRGFLRREGLILGARQTAGGRLVGYLLGNSGQTFIANHPTTQLHWDSDESKREYGGRYAAGQFTYLDQIGVAGSLHGAGIARQLHAHFLALVERPILAAIVQAPIQNRRSTVFFSKLGYRPIGMFYTAEFKGLRDVRSAVLALPRDTA